MARRAQSAGGVDEVPMVIDGGKKGLAQSMHHPNAGQGAFTTASRTNPDPPADRDQPEEHVREAYRHIASLVHGETFQGVWEAIQKLLRADREAHAPRGQTSDKLTTTKTELSATTAGYKGFPGDLPDRTIRRILVPLHSGEDLSETPRK
ncbi:hypothetical protein HRG_010079 [Hirsutella rhossiliensis]|uniref:Uncharacterized protein n=1 Tax=Hirsutella rhossiliensis TaxID=111463 RepID=A0A9P8MQ00_9HYPO|nr:uncharacterized protein HRG_10079 [Hirsutella rhossiliensis]KAH0959034.1 hypothetical protein HRG_10079 [Hirsutella rhossiliensis]